MVDGRPSNPSYSCADHEDFASTEGRLGLTQLEVIWLRVNCLQNDRASRLVQLYNRVLKRQPNAREEFTTALKVWRHSRTPGVLATHRKKGALTGNHAGSTDESTQHANHHPRSPADP